MTLNTMLPLSGQDILVLHSGFYSNAKWALDIRATMIGNEAV